jgi:hypothetical protein
MERLTQAVISGEAEGLRRYGFTLRGTMSLEQRRTEVLRQITVRTEEQTRKVRDLGEAFTRFENTAGTAFAEVMQTMMDESGPVMAMLEEMTNLLGGLIENLQAARQTNRLASAGSRSARLVQLERELVNRGVDLSSGERSWTRAESLTGVVRGLAGTREYSRETARMFGEYTRLAREMRRDPEGTTASDAAARRSVEMERAARRGGGGDDDGGGGGGGGGSRGAWGMTDLQRQLAEADQAIEAALRQVAERRAEWEEEEAERRREWFAENLESELRAFEKHEAERTRLAEMMAEARERIYEREHEIKTGLVEAEEKQDQERRERYQAVSDVMEGMIGVFHEVSTAVEEMAGAHSAATKVVAAIEGAFLVAYNVVKAITDFADAATAIAKQDYLTAALHIIAGAGHVAAAVTAGVRLGASLSGVGEAQGAAGSARSGGSRTPQRPEYHAPADRTPQGERTTVVNFNGPITSRRAHEDLRRMERDDQRRND